MRRREPGNIAAAVADEEWQRWNIGGRSDPEYVSNRANFHPGTRVVVEVPVARTRRTGNNLRTRTLHRVEANLRNFGYWPLRICFEDVARYDRDAGGTTRLRLSIGIHGGVVGARVVRSDLKHRSIAECQASALRRLKVDGTWSHQWLVEITVSVWPGDVPLAQPGKTEQELPNRPEPSMDNTLREIDESVAGCFRTARQSDAKLWGRLAVSFALGPTSNPSKIVEYQTHFGSSDAVECVAQALQTLTFDAPPTNSRFVAAWRLHPAESAINVEGTPTSSTAADE